MPDSEKLGPPGFKKTPEMCFEMLTGEASRGSDEGITSGRLRTCKVHVYIYSGQVPVADAGKLEPVTTLKAYDRLMCAHEEGRVALWRRSLAVGTYSCW
jgi:hypothetical protein